MKKYPYRARARRIGRVASLLLWWGTAILPIPIALFLLTSLGQEVVWAISISWAAAMTGIMGAFRQAAHSRDLTIRSSMSLYVDLVSPNASHYGDSFQLEYENRGTVELQAEIDLFAYPLTRGRNDELNPTFNEIYRKEIASLGPFESHELVLSPNEREDYPYTHQVALPALGLHQYVPHWLTLKIRAWPRGRPELAKAHTVIFYILWFCGQETRFPGTWMIDRNRIRSERHFSNRKLVNSWRKHIENIVEDDYRKPGLQNYIESKCSRANNDE